MPTRTRYYRRWEVRNGDGEDQKSRVCRRLRRCSSDLVSARVRAARLELVSVIIESDNVPLQSAEQDTVIDLLVQAAELCEEIKAVINDKPDYEKIEMMLKRTEVKRQSSIPHVLSWIRCSAGGIENPWVLNDIVCFAKKCKFHRELEASVLGKFESFEWGPSKCPYFKGGLVKNMMACQANHIVNGSNVYITSTELITLHKNMFAQIQIGEDIMTKGRALAQDASLASHSIDFNNILDDLDQRITGHVLKKPLLGAYTSLMQIAGVFFMELTTVARAAGVKRFTLKRPSNWVVPEETTWKYATPKTKGSVRGTKAVNTLGKEGINTDGDMQSYFKAKNLNINSMVQSRANMNTSIVTSITKDSVIMRPTVPPKASEKTYQTSSSRFHPPSTQIKIPGSEKGKANQK